MSCCRLPEAIDIFNLKVKKGGGDFSTKQNQFFLDIGWIRLTNMLDFNGMLNEFKRTDVDPRELVAMFKNLLLQNVDGLQKHFKSTDFKHDLKAIIEAYKFEKGKNDIDTEKKVKECKKIVAQILEHKDQRFIFELNKNPQAKIKFLYSKYSRFADTINV